MDSESKDATLRARVTADVYRRLSNIAASRGEQLPVIVREAVAEYLAKRLGPEGPPPEREVILEALRDKPIVVQALLDLAAAIKKPVTYRKGSRKGMHHKIPNIVQKGVEKERSAQSQPKSDA